jgi:hypothetical protein
MNKIIWQSALQAIVITFGFAMMALVVAKIASIILP